MRGCCAYLLHLREWSDGVRVVAVSTEVSLEIQREQGNILMALGADHRLLPQNDFSGQDQTQPYRQVHYIRFSSPIGPWIRTLASFCSGHRLGTPESKAFLIQMVEPCQSPLEVRWTLKMRELVPPQKWFYRCPVSRQESIVLAVLTARYPQSEAKGCWWQQKSAPTPTCQSPGERTPHASPLPPHTPPPSAPPTRISTRGAKAETRMQSSTPWSRRNGKSL